MENQMKYLLILISSLLLISCEIQPRKVQFHPPSDWKVLISDCGVRFHVKPDVKKDENAQSVDSCYEEYRNAETSIILNVAFDEESSNNEGLSWKKDFQIENIIVDGRKAELITYYDETYAEAMPDKYGNLHYAASLSISQFLKSRNLGFLTISKTPVDRNEAIKILQSVKIDDR